MAYIPVFKRPACFDLCSGLVDSSRLSVDCCVEVLAFIKRNLLRLEAVFGETNRIQELIFLLYLEVGFFDKLGCFERSL